MRNEELVEICVQYITHTESAILIQDPGAGGVWIPLSTVSLDNGDDIGEFERGETITLFVEEWQAKEKDLI